MISSRSFVCVYLTWANQLLIEKKCTISNEEYDKYKKLGELEDTDTDDDESEYSTDEKIQLERYSN